jgi:glycosyltransferase involved in cell wall biosynthesis
MIDPTKITVLICTYNRCESLRKTIESVAAQRFTHPVAWEILVVDNNSNDETRRVVDSFQSEYPERFRYILEPKQGVSHARNAGVRSARGEIIAFIDDDETADPTWLETLTSHLHSGDWAGTGGRVCPTSGITLPDWLKTDSWFAKGPLASFDAGPDTRQMNEPPFGANMAFRKDVFVICGLFRTDLGRSGNNLISNEDTEFGRRVMGAGLRIRYEPDAVAYHPVEQNRLSKGYFLTWWFNKGRSDLRELGTQTGRFRFIGIPLRLFRAFFVGIVRWMGALHPDERFGWKAQVWNCAGQIHESYLQWLNARRSRPDRGLITGPTGKLDN